MRLTARGRAVVTLVAGLALAAGLVASVYGFIALCYLVARVMGL